MKRDSGDEQNIHLQKYGKDAVAVCGVCGSILEQDKESGEYRCTECDEEQ